MRASQRPARVLAGIGSSKDVPTRQTARLLSANARSFGTEPGLPGAGPPARYGNEALEVSWPLGALVVAGQPIAIKQRGHQQRRRQVQGYQVQAAC